MLSLYLAVREMALNNVPFFRCDGGQERIRPVGDFFLIGTDVDESRSPWKRGLLGVVLPADQYCISQCIPTGTNALVWWAKTTEHLRLHIISMETSWLCRTCVVCYEIEIGSYEKLAKMNSTSPLSTLQKNVVTARKVCCISFLTSQFDALYNIINMNNVLDRWILTAISK